MKKFRRDIPTYKKRRVTVRYFFPIRKLATPPATVINYETAIGATREEQLVIMSGFARSPEDVKHLFAKYDVDTWQELFPLLPVRKHNTWKERLSLLIKRLAGHDWRNPYKLRPDRIRLFAMYVRRVSNVTQNQK